MKFLNAKIKEFLLNRKKFALELIFWIGILFIYGYVRAGFFGNVGTYVAPSYTVYGVWGEEIKSGPDIEATLKNNEGKMTLPICIAKLKRYEKDLEQ